MIISFTLENWMSFQEKVKFSMIATRERQHNVRVPKLSKYRTRILPVAAIFGGNATGKSNFFKALNFAKSLVTKGTEIDNLINVEPFRLNAHESDVPTRFAFELLINETIYDFSFAVTRTAVLEEKLVEIKSASEKVLYDRSRDQIKFAPTVNRDLFLEFAFKGTRENQLFLTNSVSQNIDDFRPVFNWFRDSLILIGPDTRFGNIELFFDESGPHYEIMNENLLQLDLGISRLAGEEIPFESIPIPKLYSARIKEDFKNKIKGNKGISFGLDGNNERYVIVRKNNELITKKLITFHPNEDGNEVKFEFSEESDGSQRVLDLLPAFIEMSLKSSTFVYFIDEIDRSLHTLLTRRLIEMYLNACSENTRTQLLLTTHDVMLMDQQLLRRDEMWVAERDTFGASSLFSFSEFQEVRYDKDIRKSYIQGRLGGIPDFFLEQTLTQ